MNRGALERVTEDFNSTLVELQEATVLLKHGVSLPVSAVEFYNYIYLIQLMAV